MKGFHGCYWRFDLSSGQSERIPIADSVLRRTLGGVGLGAWLLHKEAPPGVGVFEPEAPLIFAFLSTRRDLADDFCKIRCCREIAAFGWDLGCAFK